MKKLSIAVLMFALAIVPAASRAAETVVPLTLEAWDALACGVMTETPDGLDVAGTDYRYGNNPVTRQTFDFTQGSETFVKFMPNDWYYSYFGIGIQGVLGIGGTTNHSFAGSTLLYTDNWYYVRIQVNTDKTYVAVMSLDDYDSNGGFIVKQIGGSLTDLAWEKLKIGQINGHIVDNYAGTGTHQLIAEVRTTAVPVAVPAGATSVYDFNDGVVPEGFTYSGDWSAVDGSLRLTTSGNQTSWIALEVTDAAFVSFKVKTDIWLRSWGWDATFYFGALDAAGNSIDGHYWATQPDGCWTTVTFYLPRVGLQKLQWTYYEHNYYSSYPSLTPHSVAIDDLTIAYWDQQPPEVSDVVVSPNPARIASALTVSALVDDTATGGSAVAAAEFSLHGGAWQPLASQDGSFDSASEAVAGELVAPATPGVYRLCVRGADAAGNISTSECTPLVVYDPDGGFVTGGGWIESPAGAAADPTVAGKANFGFNAKYHKGKTVPDGQTQFSFQAAGLTFHSTSYQWLVVNQGASNAQFKGGGTLNGKGPYQFMVWANDGDVDSDPNSVDTFRIRVWQMVDGVEITAYDNGAHQPLGGGSVSIHARKN